MPSRYQAIELRLLRGFVALAEELNFGRAAERLNLSQPSLSAQIRQLEEKLGIALFVRNTRRVALTAEGAALLSPAQTLLAESLRFGEAVEQVRGRPERRLVLGSALYTLGIPEREQLLEAFVVRYPEIPFTVTPRWQREMARALMRGEADLALMLGASAAFAQWEAEPTAEVLIPESLPRLVLRDERIALLVPRESPLADHDPIPPERLQGTRLVMLGDAHGAPLLTPLRDMLSSAGAQLIVPPEPHGIGVERYGRQFRIPAVSLGWLGTGGPEDPDMVRRYVSGLELKTQLALVRAPGRPSRAAQLFWQEARARFPTSKAFEPERAAGTVQWPADEVLF